MNHTLHTDTPHIIPSLSLNDDTAPRHYTAEICNMTKQGEKKTYTAIVQEFQLLYTGSRGDFRHYQMNTKDRFYLNERYNIIRQLNKAQNIGLQVAKINDQLVLTTDPHFKFIQITNSQTIRNAWQDIRTSILEQHPDLHIMADKFDQQLKDDQIQKSYQNDNFFNFFFANIFHQKINLKSPTETQKIISNAIDYIHIPIIEKRIIHPSDEHQTTVSLSAEINPEDPRFPLNELTKFLGTLPALPGSQQALRLQYSGIYQIDTQQGIITQASLNYTFSLGELYEKTTIMNLDYTTQ